tara:strand:- start:4050 stop:5045 length:996 start_codon:yes stop_codon:yes gene_type:complete
MINSYIRGIAHYVPEEILTNEDLSKLMDTSDEWIRTRTGIHKRHTVGDTNLGPADLAVKASNILFEKLKLNKDEIDFVVFATSTPDYFVPGSGSIFQDKLGLNNIGVLDIRQGCSGFTYALTVADNFIKSGSYKNILVVGSEVQTTQLDFDDQGRGTAVLFGDGAAVCLVSATNEDKGILSSHLHADGKYIEELGTEFPSSRYKDIITSENVKERKHHIHMNGREVFKHAVRRFPEVILEGLEYNNLKIEDVDLVVPHQANFRITQAVQKKLNIPENKVFSNIHKYGNTTAASIGIALSEALNEKLIKSGDIIVLASFGAGWYWGSVIIKW